MSTPSLGQHSGDEPFTVVPAALVRRLGGGNPAIVYARITWRCQEPGRDRIEDEAGRWWRVTRTALAEETGLTEKQARTALQALLTKGEIESIEHRHGGYTDRTPSYRTTTLTTEWPKAATRPAQIGHSRVNATAQTGHSSGPNGPVYEWPKRATLPLIETLETKEGGTVRDDQPSTLPELEPPTRCPRHLNEAAIGPCGPCGDARRTAGRWNTQRAHDQATEAQQRRQQITGCDRCDDNGILELEDGRATRCNHLAPEILDRERSTHA